MRVYLDTCCFNDCSSYFELLVSVALQHRFEASLEARSILMEHDLVLQNDQIVECMMFIDSVDLDALTDFQREASADIRERFYGEQIQA